MTELSELKLVADLVPRGAHVLDLACGDGRLLEYLREERQCTGYGVEQDDALILRCAGLKVNVLQLDLSDALTLFDDQSFDVVLQLNALQHLRHPEAMLREMARVGCIGIVSFPNFAHWPNRINILRGRLPVTKRLPYQWYDTPNIRIGSYVVMGDLAAKQGLRIVDSFGIHEGSQVRAFPNFFASVALFKFERFVG